MGNKKKTYLLLLIVILVWSLIIYRIYSAVNPATPKVEINDEIPAFKPYKIAKKDTFSIKVDYRDPFLGKYISNSKTKKPKRVSIKKQIEKPKKEKKIVFPRIEYKGIISPKSRFDKRFILKINQRTFLYSLLETHKDVQLLQGDNKEIVVFYKGEQKIIILK